MVCNSLLIQVNIKELRQINEKSFLEAKQDIFNPMLSKIYNGAATKFIVLFNKYKHPDNSKNQLLKKLGPNEAEVIGKHDTTSK